MWNPTSEKIQAAKTKRPGLHQSICFRCFNKTFAGLRRCK